MAKRKWLWPAAVLALAVALAGCGGADDNGNGGGSADPAPNAGTEAGTNNGDTGADSGNGDAVAADAEAIYAQSCVGCHAADLTGNLGPNSDISAVGSRLSEEEIRNVISNGRGGMPAFQNQLSAEEIDALSAWLAAKQ